MRTVRRDFWTGGLDWDVSGLDSDDDDDDEEAGGGEGEQGEQGEEGVGMREERGEDDSAVVATHQMVLMEAVSEEDEEEANGADAADEADLSAFLAGDEDVSRLGTVAEQRTLEALEQAEADLDAFVAAGA